MSDLPSPHHQEHLLHPLLPIPALLSFPEYPKSNFSFLWGKSIPLPISVPDSTFPTFSGHGCTEKHLGAKSYCWQHHLEAPAWINFLRRHQDVVPPKPPLEPLPHGKNLLFVPYTTLGGAGLHLAGSSSSQRSWMKPGQESIRYVEVLWSGLCNPGSIWKVPHKLGVCS